MRISITPSERMAAAWKRLMPEREAVDSKPVAAKRTPPRREPRCRYTENRVSKGQSGAPDLRLFVRISIRIVRDGLSCAVLAQELGLSQERIRQYVRFTLAEIADTTTDDQLRDLCGLQLQGIRKHPNRALVIDALSQLYSEGRDA